MFWNVLKWATDSLKSADPDLGKGTPTSPSPMPAGRRRKVLEQAPWCSRRRYLIKHTPADCVCHAIREVHKGKPFFSPSIPKRLHKRNQNKKRRRLARINHRGVVQIA